MSCIVWLQPLSDFGSVQVWQSIPYRGYPLFLSTFAPHVQGFSSWTCQISFRDGRYDVIPSTCWGKKLQNHLHRNLTRLSLFHLCGPPSSSLLCPPCLLLRGSTLMISGSLIIDMDTPTNQPRKTEERGIRLYTHHRHYARLSQLHS